MAVARRAWEAYGANKASSTSITTNNVSGGGVGPVVGDVIVGVITMDNIATTAPTITAVSAVSGGTVVLRKQGSSGSTQSSAGAGSITGVFLAEVTADFTAASQISVVYGTTAVTAKTLDCFCLSGVDISNWASAPPSAITQANASTVTISTSVSALAVDGAFVGGCGTEAPAQPTMTSYAPSAPFAAGFSTTGGNSTTNVGCQFFMHSITAATTYSCTWSVTDGGGVGFILLPAPTGTGYTASPGEPVGITDFADDQQGNVRAPADPVGVTDFADDVQGNVRSQADQVGVTDSAQAVLTGPQNYIGDTPGSGSSMSEDFSTFPTDISIYDSVTQDASVGNPAPSLKTRGDLPSWFGNSARWFASGDFTASFDIIAHPSGATGIREIYDAAFWWNGGSGGTGFFYRVQTANTDGGFFATPGYTRIDSGSTVPFPEATWCRITIQAVGTVVTVTVRKLSDGSLVEQRSMDLASYIGVGGKTTSGYFGQQPDGAGTADGTRIDNFSATVGPASEAVGVTDAVVASLGYTPSVPESVGVTDAVTALLARAQAPADPVGVTDSVAAVMTGARTQPDSVGVTDSANANLILGTTDYTGSPADPVAVGDTVTSTDVYVRSTDEPVGVTDAMARAMAYQRPQADAVGVTDALTQVGTAARTPDEPVGVSDALALDRATGAADPVGVTDAASTSLDNVRSQDDAVGVTDTASAVQTFASALAFDTSGSTAQTSGTTSAFSVDITNAQVGAGVFAFVAVNAISATISLPGWTQLWTAPTASTLTGALFYRQKVSGDTTFAGTQNTGRSVVGWASYVGLDATPYEVTVSPTVKNGSSTSITTGSVTETGGDSWALAFFANRTSTSANRPMSFTPDAALTERLDASNDTATSSPWVAVEIADSAAPVTAGAHSYTATLPFAETYGIGAIVYLQPALQTSGGSKTVGDQANVTDAAATALGVSQAPADPVGATDTVSASQAAVRVPADAVGVTDATVVATGWGRTQADAVGATDAVTVTQSQTAIVTDPVGASDGTTLQQAGVSSATLDEAVGLSDAATATQNATRAPADGIGVSDAISVAVARSISDPVGLTDAAAPATDFTRTLAEPVGLTDAAKVARAVTLAEQVGVADVLIQRQGIARTFTEQVGVTDEVTRDREVVLDDQLDVTDAVDVVADAVVDLNDNLFITDPWHPDFDLVLNEAIKAKDKVTLARDVPRDLAETVGVTDAVDVVMTIDQTFTDPAPVTDTATAIRFGTLDEPVALSDGLVVVLAHNFDVPHADAVQVTDSASAAAANARSQADPVAVTDSVSASLHRVVDIVDLVQAADATALDYLAVTDDVVPVSDEVATLLHLGVVIEKPNDTHVTLLPGHVRHVVVADGQTRHVIPADPTVRHIVVHLPGQKHIVLTQTDVRHVVLRLSGQRHVVMVDPAE